MKSPPHADFDPGRKKHFPEIPFEKGCKWPLEAVLSSLGGGAERRPRSNPPPLLDLRNRTSLFLVRLRWSGTDLEAGFVVYAENGPRKVFGVSLGDRMCAPHGISQIPGASGRGTPVAPPAAAHAALRRLVGGGEVACE